MLTTDLWLELVVVALAAWRITRLVIADTFPPVKWVRDRILSRWPSDTTIGSLVTCVYCAGFWISCLVTLWWVHLGVTLLMPWALSALVAYLHRLSHSPA